MPPVPAGEPVAAILFWLIAWRNCLLSAIRMMTSGAGRQHTDLGQHPGLHLLTVACPCGWLLSGGSRLKRPTQTSFVSPV
jgi:hypothetical protein